MAGDGEGECEVEGRPAAGDKAEVWRSRVDARARRQGGRVGDGEGCADDCAEAVGRAARKSLVRLSRNRDSNRTLRSCAHSSSKGSAEGVCGVFGGNPGPDIVERGKKKGLGEMRKKEMSPNG